MFFIIVFFIIQLQSELANARNDLFSWNWMLLLFYKNNDIFLFSDFLTFYSLWFYHLKIYVDKNSRVVGRWLLWAKVKRLKVALDFSGNNSPPHSRQQLLCPRPGVSWQSDSKLVSRVLQDLHLTRSLCNDLDWALFTVYHSLLGRRDYLWNSKEEQTAC